MLDIDKRKKVTKPDYPKKFWIIQKVQKCGQNDSFWTIWKRLSQKKKIVRAVSEKND